VESYWFSCSRLGIDGRFIARDVLDLTRSVSGRFSVASLILRTI
jgi:hypothetical protein